MNFEVVRGFLLSDVAFYESFPTNPQKSYTHLAQFSLNLGVLLNFEGFVNSLSP
jgi:hypothetical protein